MATRTPIRLPFPTRISSSFSTTPSSLLTAFDRVTEGAIGTKPKLAPCPTDTQLDCRGRGTDVVETEPFESIRVSAIDENETPEWLVSELWAASGCGIIGGEPKACKTWLGLDIALSVASGTPCLDQFEVPEAGTVLVYLAEDALTDLKARVASIARSRSLDLEDLPLYTLTVPRIRIDRPQDQERLAATVEKLKPKLLLLDPLVRISGADENSANEIADVLGYLRNLQKQFDSAIMLVHHSRKARFEGTRQSGIDLRGSGDLYAWGDSYLFVNKSDNGLVVTGEHRNARAPDDFGVALIEDENGMRLRLSQPPPKKSPIQKAKPSLQDRILECLGAHGEPLNVHDLRERIGGSNESHRAALKLMLEEGQVRKEGAGYLPV